MAIKLMTWNLYEGLGVAERSSAIVEAVKQHDADLALLTDAYWPGNPKHSANLEIAGAAKEKFRQVGYDIFETEYKDGRYWPGRALTLLARIAVQDQPELKLGFRNGLDIKVRDPDLGYDLHLIGAHFDDYSEKNRQEQAQAVIDHVCTEQPTALLGDLNAMHRTDLVPKIFGNSAVRSVARRVPNARLRSMARRATEMSASPILETLTAAGLKDSDKMHRPTFPSRLPIFQLDHCLVSRPVLVPCFEVTEHNPASDHRAIALTVTV